MACSGPSAPYFVNDDYVTAEITRSTEHACHKILAWSRVVVCGMPVGAPSRNWRRYCCVTAVGSGSARRGENTERP